MFSGIVQEIGLITKVEISDNKTILHIKGNTAYKNIKIDDSIAVNGCCLTVTSFNNGIATFDVLPETLRKTNLGNLKENSLVNLESSITLQDKIGGHNIQGHVDCTAKIIHQDKDGDAITTTFKINKEFGQILVPKCFISIDGISLTVINCSEDIFSVMLIPHTINLTIAKNWDINTICNIEIDIINKSIFHYIKLFMKK